MEFREYDRLVINWIQAVEESLGVNAELTFKYCNDIIALGNKKQDKKLLGFAYFYLGQTYYCLNDSANFFDCTSRAVGYLVNIGEWDLLARCYNCLGISAANRGNMPMALDYYLKGLRCCKNYTDSGMQECAIAINVGSMDLQVGRFQEAISYLNQAYQFIMDFPTFPEYHPYSISILVNLAKCYLFQEKYDMMTGLFGVLKTSHWNYAEDIDKISIWCVEAMYYHRINHVEERNQRIAYISQCTTNQVAIMDIFDDYFDYCHMLLETDCDDEFWHIIEVIEPIIKMSKTINLQQKIISLKVKYYRSRGKGAEYLQSAGLFFELSELKEQENKSMMNIMLSMQMDLEAAEQKQKQMEAENQKLIMKSELDALTLLPNRYRLERVSEQTIQSAIENHHSIVVEIMDIDYFKELNDNYGHQYGDKALASLARALQEVTEKYNGFCARYGGDEFVIIYENLTFEEANERAEATRNAIMNLNLEHKYSKALPIMTVSQGLCYGLPEEGQKIKDYLRAADGFLYEVKRHSRNNFRVGTMSEAQNGESVTRENA